MLEFYEKRITSLETRMEKIRDSIASLKASNGGG
jgi:chaperonin cofactor prefoldin